MVVFYALRVQLKQHKNKKNNTCLICTFSTNKIGIKNKGLSPQIIAK